MSTVEGLMRLGLTEYEARVYVVLLSHPGQSGYELSRLSGVPRSKVYETLDGLARKGAATSVMTDGRQVYSPLPHELLLSRHEAETSRTLAQLASALSRLTHQPEGDSVSTVTGDYASLQRLIEVVRGARLRLLVAGWPEDLRLLASHLAEAESRGVKVFVLVYGSADLGLAHVTEHPVSGLQYLQLAVMGRWLGLVSDYREAVLALFKSESLAVWGSSQGLVQALALWIQHDITIAEYSRHLPAEMLASLPPEVVQGLALMSMLEPGELAAAGGNEPIDGSGSDVDGAAELLLALAARLSVEPLSHEQLAGNYAFVFGTEPGSTFTLAVTAHGSSVGGRVPSDALTITISPADFTGLLRGTLPMLAFMERGRIRLQGDIALAANLEKLLRV